MMKKNFTKLPVVNSESQEEPLGDDWGDEFTTALVIKLSTM